MAFAIHQHESVTDNIFYWFLYHVSYTWVWFLYFQSLYLYSNVCMLSHLSCIWLFVMLMDWPARLLCPWDFPSKNTRKWNKLFSRVRLCDPMDCSLPGSSVHGIFSARVLEWVAIAFSRGQSRPRDQTHVFYVSCTDRQVLYH